MQPYRDFIAAYVGAVSTSLSPGDPAPWLAMSDPACENCQFYAQNVRDAFADGGRIDGGRWDLAHAVVQETGELGQVWFVDVRSARERWLDAKGNGVKVVDAGIDYLGCGARLGGGLWMGR